MDATILCVVIIKRQRGLRVATVYKLRTYRTINCCSPSEDSAVPSGDVVGTIRLTSPPWRKLDLLESCERNLPLPSYRAHPRNNSRLSLREKIQNHTRNERGKRENRRSRDKRVYEVI